MAEVEKEFFPIIVKEKRDEEERKDPKKYAERIAREIIDKAMKVI